jgi:predicted glutamine amidotransferase
LITEPSNSIIHQSFHSYERKEPLNGDGFGLAWYVPELTDQPALFKDVCPAWNNVNLLQLARVTRTPCLLAHVRAASPGLSVSQLNCHPFTRGPFAFMHNGTVGGFRTISRKLKSGLSDDAYHWIQGSTDSELIFAIFLDQYTGNTTENSLERIVGALTKTIAHVESVRRDAGVEESSQLNLAVTDGRCAVVSRFISREPDKANSLYVHVGGRYECEGGICQMRPASAGNQAVIVASEPLSKDPGWQPVAANHLVIVDEDLHVEQRPIQP